MVYTATRRYTPYQKGIKWIWGIIFKNSHGSFKTRGTPIFVFFLNVDSVIKNF